MKFPTIHLNGTSRKALHHGYREAALAVKRAIDATAETYPNARDYYPQGDEAFYAARQEHEERVRLLAVVHGQLLDLVYHCQEKV